jgi:hypothetical protein
MKNYPSIYNKNNTLSKHKTKNHFDRKHTHTKKKKRKKSCTQHTKPLLLVEDTCHHSKARINLISTQSYHLFDPQIHYLDTHAHIHTRIHNKKKQNMPEIIMEHGQIENNQLHIHATILW